MEAERPELDFPAERVWDLSKELYRILLGYFAEAWAISRDSLERYGRIVILRILDWWSTSREVLNETIRSLFSRIPEKRKLERLVSVSKEWLLAFRGRPLWIQAILVSVGIFVTRRFLAAMHQQMRRRQRRRQHRRRLSMKTGQSEILQGRTSLVYGAAGDLRDEEYLDDATPESGGRMGRFGTFDFFGINSTTAATSKQGRRSYRKHSYSSGDDQISGTGKSGSSHLQRTRTMSTESLGNRSGAAIVRTRNDSMESLTDTLGGLFQTFKGPPASTRAGVSRAQGNNKKVITKSNESNRHENDTATASNRTLSKHHKNKRHKGDHHNTDKSSRFRKERLGSMDIYYAPGKSRSMSNTVADDRRLFSSQISSWEETNFENFDGNDDMRYLHDEFGIVTLSHKVKYYGPFRSLLNCGSTFVPPLPFEVVSRKIASPENDLPLKRLLRMDLLKGSLKVIEPTTSVSLNQKFDYIYENIDNISMKFKRPLESAVLHIYQKGTPIYGPDWKEHTFESAHAAAQFQSDLLAYQVLGKPLRHIFEALHLVHQGSLACKEQEFILHDDIRRDRNDEDADEDADKGEGKAKNKANQSIESTSCVAWDDAMRAMSSIPTVRIALERLWLSHNRPSVIAKAPKSAKDKTKIALDNEKVSRVELRLLREEYIKKRLLLGPVDFFRLFVPTLPETTIPKGKYSNEERMKELLCWRKRVARASVLVRSYIRARMVANLGWNLERGLTVQKTLDTISSSMGTLGDFGGEQITKRFAYDRNEDNHLRDVSAKNEIYEASVSRDVLCHVRPYDYLSHNENNGKLQNSDIDDNGKEIVQNGQYDYENRGISGEHFVLSPYQAYTYVESHYFKVTDAMLDEDGPLHPSNDPVEMFPSLKDIIVRHPDLDFFVDCLSNPEDKIFVVNLHVRSLAKGIDPQFDNVIDRFSNATEEVRNRKLYFMVQLGNWMGLSFLGWLSLTVLSFYFRFTETCRDSPMNLESTRDRYGFPGFRIGGLFKTYHFGGSLQTEADKPSNYIGLTKCTASYYENLVSKIVIDKLQRHFFESTVDLTYVIEGEKNDELPERALSSLRIVHVNPNKVSKDPRPYLAIRNDSDLNNSKITAKRRSSSVTFPRIALQDAVQYSLDSVRTIVHSGLPLMSPEKKEQTKTNITSLGTITEGEEDDTVGTVPLHLRREGGTMDPLEKGIDVIINVLRSVVVPCRHRLNRLNPKSSKRWEEDTEGTGLVVVSQVPVLRLFDRSDVGRYIRKFDYDLMSTSKRLVETALWRGKIFPVNKRRCRIELQSGQCFQQGFDKDQNPVFYFRNLCRGPWRGDSNATILAILYRLDKSLNELCKVNPHTKVTLVVLMGHAKHQARKKKKQNKSRGNE